MDQELSGGLKALLIIGTIIFPGPLLGIILGIIWMTDQNASLEKKKFGKILLFIGIGVPILGCICYLLFFIGIVGIGSIGSML
ncbi:MAG: hypothetical protein PWP07_1517 [Epulopiscium sp.]|jgi:hypothetical protein|uniref:Uncharacterized protein n=1 Tax=Defluviitalea raffinosedens TaxID=1450156 RepID=A0A7C8LTA2_9FIRM|nr:hypothetical protein [Defluviitalea raffinosedens]KAE9634406.1 hypothetical protein GND95_06960 [Defluviitalea raffinosedens]MBZ4668280.1 hypothetical protein [Defluviitaleaceae bacterium]MDK2788272.1 hypothetical protein [Candidatus Epulonipiscium sp.]HHW67039.1 hypothetical protein [Candidatus Epulonipiscium sp.]